MLESGDRAAACTPHPLLTSSTSRELAVVFCDSYHASSRISATSAAVLIGRGLSCTG
jgi:hypothetical protein